MGELTAPQASALSTGTGLISGIIDNIWADQRAKKAYKRQQALIADERQYNDPTAQMERYRQAGINPMMALSKSSSMQNTVSSSGKSAPMAQGRPLQLGESVRQGLLMKAQLENINADTNQKNSNAKLLDQKTLNQDIDNFVDSFQAQYWPTGAPATYRDKKTGEQINANEMYKNWLKGDEDVPPYLQQQYMSMTRQRLDNQNTAIRIQINQAEANLKKLGYTFSDDMAVRVGITMALEKGYDMSTVQGLTMAYGLIASIAPVFMRTGAIGKVGRNIGKGKPTNPLGGKIKSRAKTTRKIGKDTRTVEKINYH